MKGHITKAFVDSIQPSGRDLIVHDLRVRGFGLKVTPTGSKIYLVWYRLEGGRTGSE